MTTTDGFAGSLSDFLRLVASGRATTRSELARVTGLARSTVGIRVDALRNCDLLVQTDMAEVTGGRPAIRLMLNPQAGILLGADLGARHWRIIATDLAATPIAEEAGEFDIAAGPDPVLPTVARRFADLLQRTGHQPDEVRAIGIGVPGPVEFATGTVIRPPIMPGWDGVRVPGYFRDTFPAPVLVDNDVNIMALGEYDARNKPTEFLLFIKVGTGIGCGIVNQGRLHRGADGAAGDIGHIKLPGDDVTHCSCGNVGCVEAVASGRALAQQLSAADLHASGTDDVVRLALDGDPLAVRAIREAARQIGGVVAALVNFHNPSRIVVGGPFSPVQYDLLAGIRAVVYQRATPLATRALTIEASQLEDRAGAVGAALLAREHILSPSGVQHLLERAGAAPSRSARRPGL
jgi:predicted NBD/HSP70 family sugar kinase